MLMNIFHEMKVREFTVMNDRRNRFPKGSA